MGGACAHSSIRRTASRRLLAPPGPPAAPLMTSAPESTKVRPLTGFVRIEESDGRQSKSVTSPPSGPPTADATPVPTPAKARARARVCSRWLYGVLKGDSLRLYWRRTDYKRRAPPLDELSLLLQADAGDDSAFGFDHECVYVRAKDTGRLLSIRIHQKKDIVRWVTALYYQSLRGKDDDGAGSKDEARGRSASLASRGASGSDTSSTSAGDSARAKRKSVSFQDEPQVLVLPRQSYDPDDLFYSSVDYEQFLHDRKAHLPSLMRAIYSKTAAKLRVSHKKHLRADS